MSGFVLDEVRPTAIKTHLCECCLGTIGVGDQYLRQRNVGDDGPYVFKAHALCWSLSIYIAREEGYWDGEWSEPDEVREALARWFGAVADPWSKASPNARGGASHG